MIFVRCLFRNAGVWIADWPCNREQVSILAEKTEVYGKVVVVTSCENLSVHDSVRVSELREGSHSFQFVELCVPKFRALLHCGLGISSEARQ